MRRLQGIRFSVIFQFKFFCFKLLLPEQNHMSLKVKKTIIKSMLLAFCFVSLSLTASAAGLGKLNVLSALGEPLNAEIDLLTTPEELLSLNASLASDDQYLAQGIDKSVIQKNIQISVVKKSEGISVLKIVSSQAVTDPFLDMLIQVSWNEGKLSREYTLLLDPPGQNDAYVESPEVDALNPQSATEDALTTAKPGKSNPISQSVKSISRSGSLKTKQGLTEGQKIIISKGDTLGTIAKRLQVVDVNLDQMLIGLYKANPLAFKDGNINRLIIGQVIDVPNADVLQQVSKEAS
jgi:pilus assembly protein FimV